jgi:hypothetical protein
MEEPIRSGQTLPDPVLNPIHGGVAMFAYQPSYDKVISDDLKERFQKDIQVLEQEGFVQLDHVGKR